MKENSRIENTLEKAMTKQFLAAKDSKTAIHMAAVAGAGICAVLPIGVDAWALRCAEIFCIMRISALYGENLTKAAGRGLLASSFAQLVGEKAALAALAAANATNILNPVVAYGIKASIAVTLIEAVGHAALDYYRKKYENPSMDSKTLFDGMCVVGGIRDAAALAGGINHLTEGSLQSTGGMEDAPLKEIATAPADLAFTGRGEGRSGGWSESSWIDLYEKAVQDGSKVDKDYALKGLKKAVRNRVESEIDAERIVRKMEKNIR